jgi:phosphogluconate dehydratase
MSGASGKVPAAIHVTPECLAGGPLALVRNGDPIVLDGERGVLDVRVDAAEWQARRPELVDVSDSQHGMGRELFAAFRANARGAEEGAITFDATEPQRAARADPAVPIHDHFVFAERSAS